MTVKNISFGGLPEFEGNLVPVMDKITNGVRPAVNNPSLALKKEITPREPIKIPLKKDENGETSPDYAAMEKPAFMRKLSKSGLPLELSHECQKNTDKVDETVTAIDPLLHYGVKTASVFTGLLSTMKTFPNNKLGCVDFKLENEDLVALRRFPDSISAGDRELTDDIILAMLELGKNDFGVIEVFGSKEFISRSIKVALEHNIVLQNKEYTQALGGTHERQSSRSPMKQMRG